MISVPDDDIPLHTTHVAQFYGRLYYFRKTLTSRYNDVCERWQNLTTWYEWDFNTRAWCPTGAGFSDRRLEELKPSQKVDVFQSSNNSVLAR